jgi:hypothetical protein
LHGVAAVYHQRNSSFPSRNPLSSRLEENAAGRAGFPEFVPSD